MKFDPRRLLPRSRRAKLWLTGVAIALTSLAIVVPVVLGKVVRARLQTLVAEQLDAELRVERFVYRPPYGVTIHNAKLLARAPGGGGEQVSILDVRRLDLTLARSPLRSGPLVIEEFAIQGPAVHLIKTPEGFVGAKAIKKPPEDKPWKLSDVLELRRFAITGGQVVYEDRSRATDATPAAPLVWRGLQFDLKTRPQSDAKGVYAYHVKAAAVPSASIDARGDVDVDELVVNVAACALDVALKPDASESPLPAAFQQMLRPYELDGRLRVSLTGTAPLRDIDRATFDGTIDLSGARGRVPQYAADVRSLGLAIAFSNVPAAGSKPDPRSVPPLRIQLKNLAADTSEGKLQLAGGDLVIWNNGWDIKSLDGTLALPPSASRNGPLARFDPRGTLRFTGSAYGMLGFGSGVPTLTHYDAKLDATQLAARIPNVPRPIEDFTGSIKLTDGELTLQPLAVRYGDRAAVKIQRGRATFGGGEWQLDELIGRVEFLPSKADENRTDVLDDIDARGALRFTASAHGTTVGTEEDPSPGINGYDVALAVEELSARVPQLPKRVKDVKGALRIADNTLTFVEPVTANYADRAAVTVAAGGQFDFGKLGWAVKGVSGNVRFHELPATVPFSSVDPLYNLDPLGELDFSIDASSLRDEAAVAAAALLEQPAPPPTTTYRALLTARDLSLVIAALPERLSKLNGTIQLDQDAVQAQDLKGAYAADEFTIATARVPLAKLNEHILIEDIAVALNFGSPAATYPPALAPVLATLEPIGAYQLAGHVDVDRTGPKVKTDYKLTVTSDTGALSPDVKNVPVLFPRGIAVITPQAVDLPRLEVPAFGGKVAGNLRVKLGGTRTTYEGAFDIKDVALDEAKVLWLDKGESDQDLRGRASGRVKIRGDIPPDEKTSALDSFRAEGSLKVAEGHFYDVPVLRQISDWLHIDGGSVIGDAAATFAIQDRVVELRKGVVSAPVMALQGKGTVGFDGKLDLVVTGASPRQEPGRGKGGVDDFVGGIIGAVNRGLAGAGQWGLYEFHVTGDNDKPQVRVVTPAINQTIDSIVGGIRDFAREAGKK